MNKNSFVSIMTALAGNFGAQLQKETLSLWYDLFTQEEITIEQIREAAKEILKTRDIKSMPTYAEFRSHIIGTIDDMAQVQADNVVNAIRHNGAYWTPKFDDPITQQIITTKWRWKTICETLMESQTQFFIRDFKEAYKTYTKTNKQNLIAIENKNGKIKQLTSEIGKI